MREISIPAALRYIEQVARSGSIQQASRTLHIAASAIDRHIREMEDDLGVPLFERHPRGMTITAAGECLVAMVRKWRSDSRNAFSEIQQLRGVEQGTVRIGCMDSHANGIIAAVVLALNAGHPGISLDVEVASTDDVVRMLLEGDVDIGVAFNAPARRELHVIHAHELPFGCVVAPSHPLAKQKSTTLQQCGKYPLALQSGALVIGRMLNEDYGWLVGRESRPVITNSIQLIKTLARSGGYAAFLTQIDAAPEIQAGELVFVKVRDALAAPETLSVLADARRSLPRISRLVAAAVDEQIRQAALRVA
ncbi:MAG: LysR family transcriptional regulator [Moraxellaceae bacterium]|nr:LysR family transcriptional regulator [Moraxellaceae bacterium]